MGTLLAIILQLSASFAQSIGTIQKLDLSDDRPPDPTYRLIILDVKKLKNSGARGHIILRQFSNRVRVEFDGAGLPKGEYTIALAPDCSMARQEVSSGSYKNNFKELHRFPSKTSHVETEKSQPKAKLADMDGKSVALFRAGKSAMTTIDCRPVVGSGWKGTSGAP